MYCNTLYSFIQDIILIILVHHLPIIPPSHPALRISGLSIVIQILFRKVPPAFIASKDLEPHLYCPTAR